LLNQKKKDMDNVTTQIKEALAESKSGIKKNWWSTAALAALKPLDLLVLFSTFLILFGAVGLFYALRPQFELQQLNRLKTGWGTAFIGISMLLLAFRLSFYLVMFVLHRRYKPMVSVSDEALPMVTVIVPAFNEGKLVWQTLKSLAASNYPAEKLELLAIDDGSQDDTWAWMQQAKSMLGNRVSIYQQPKNMGKRHALYRGFKLGKGQVFVTVDSDSLVKTDTLRNLVSPFIHNQNCGAVAGNVRVLNTQKSMIPKMLNVSFAFSFEFIRSAQSVLKTVLCTPGALSAYRRDAVFNCLEAWMNQTFMGQRSDIGEDRAMTNMILKQGLDVQFQSNALVLTDTPEKYKNLYKMFIRWERSNVRENIMMSKFAFSNFRNGSKVGPRFLLVNQWLRILTAYPFTLLMLASLAISPILFMTTLLVSILLFSSIPAVFFALKHGFTQAIWAYSYGIFYAFALFWITPYAIATANRRGWLTRG
jgi:hyaluronan synthase